MIASGNSPPELTITGWMLDGIQKAPLQESANPKGWVPGDGPRWLDVQIPEEPMTAWQIQPLSDRLAISPAVANLAVDLDHHPRLTRHGQGVILCLWETVVGTDQPHVESIPFNLWCDGQQIITLHHQPVNALAALADALQQEQKPLGAAGALVWLLDKLVQGMHQTISHATRQVHALETSLQVQDVVPLNGQFVWLRNHLSRLFLFHAEPQLQALRTLARLPLAWLDDQGCRPHLKECLTRFSRALRELTHLNKRLEHLQEGFSNMLDHRLNSRVYNLTMITGIAFPMVFLTGLLGVNLGGIPGSDNPWAFTIFCLFLIVLGWTMAWWFHRQKWL
ncbi:MAG: hypothetical protein G8345_14255 [Magnetococcales bacterium]|nr:hypothetical protein [Magnetococcales bacterium]NGZ28040.1 hypothetical protein [Magnetococcales bacterium]